METLTTDTATDSNGTGIAEVKTPGVGATDPAALNNPSMANRGGRSAGIFVVLGLLLLLGGAVTYLFVSSGSPKTAQASPKKAISYEAYDAILNSAQTLINQGENAKAEALFKQVLASHPDAQPVQVQYAQFLAAQKRPAEAYEHYIAALTIGPDSADVELEAGTAASMCGKLERAVDHYMSAEQGNKSDYRAPLNLGMVLAKLNRNDEAKAALLRSAELKPDVAAPAWGTLADIALRENKPSIALNYITKARELAPNVTVYRVIHARALKRSGDATAALQQLIGLSDAEKREPGVMQTMAECYGMLQRPADAAKLYSDASDSDQNNGDWAFQAAVWLDKAGDRQRAADYAKRAAELKVEGAEALAARLSK
jgi:tetratricopeptide (TPR) repeat protein